MQETFDFDGETYDKEIDGKRLTNQLLHVFTFMSPGEWKTLEEISEATEGMPQSISARLRDLRKERFGSHTIMRRRRETKKGLWEYKLVINTKKTV